MIFLISCRTVPVTPEPIEIDPITVYAPLLPDTPSMAWQAEGGKFYLDRDDAVSLAEWFVDVRAYKELLELTFREIENAVLSLTGDELLHIQAVNDGIP